MDLSFSSEQNMLRDSASRFLANECPFEKVKELEESAEGYSPDLWKQVAELGWLGMAFPEEHGGFGGTFMDLVVIQEEIGKTLFPSPFFSTVVECGTAISEGGSEEQKVELLSAIAEGSLIIGLAQYEEDGSYLESGITMQAAASGEDYALSGTKYFVRDANIAHKLIVAAVVEGKGPTLFLVDAQDPGITVTKMPTVAMDNTCEVKFSNVTVFAKDIIGAQGGAWPILEATQARAAIAQAAEMLGGCKACIAMTVGYAKEREQYGRAIGGNQVIQHYLANMLLAHDTANSYLYQVASMVDNGEDFAASASALKAATNENYKFVSERSVQIHGGIGTTREHNIGLFYRRAKSYESRCGSTDLHYEKVMKGLLQEA